MNNWYWTEWLNGQSPVHVDSTQSRVKVDSKGKYNSMILVWTASPN